MKEELKKLIWEECNKASNFIEIPAIYKHFKETKDGEDMMYAVSSISVPITFEEFLYIDETIKFREGKLDTHTFYHTEQEKDFPIYRVDDRYFHPSENDSEKLVIYTGLYGDRKTYVRPLPMFLSRVDKGKYPSATQKFRLERIL